MSKATLVGLMMLVVGGCAREAVVAAVPASAPAEMSAECAGDCAPELDEYENECQAVASREWNKARSASYHRSPESAEAAADEAYEDTYTRCIDAHCDGFCDAPVSAPAQRGAPTVAEAKALGFPACATEDSCGCYWDAATRGNGKGRSFVAEPCEMPGAEEEVECMAVAEKAYERAAGHAMTSLGDAPVPDAAYEDAYAACTEGR